MSCHETQNTECDKSYDFNCSFLESFPRPIKSIIAWRCPYFTGSVIGALVLLTVMVKTMSFVSVLAYLGLMFIAASMLFRFYCNFINNEAGHPLQELLDKDVKVYLAHVSQLVQHQTDDVDSSLNRLVAYLRDIFLLNSYTDAAKFFIVNLALVYVGMCFNLIDLVLLAALALLVGPKIYSLYRTQIDDSVLLARAHLARLLDTVKDKIATLPIIGSGKSKQL